MCHLCVANTNDESMNKSLLSIMGDFGSILQDDGWGISDGYRWWKTAKPFYLTTNAGEIIRRELPRTGKRPLLLHLRQASPQVPVCNDNSHPFSWENLVLVHNGKLVPRDEKQFVMEEDIPDVDDKTGEVRLDAAGNPKTRTVKRSDTLIFFERMVQIYQLSETKNLYEVLCDTMKEFTGKFAFIIHDGDKMYVVRGRSADLYISYLREKEAVDSPVTGFVINTSKDSMLHSILLASHLQQIQGGSRIHFSTPKLIDEESMFAVEKFDLKLVGKVKENYAPVPTTSWKGGREGVAGGSNFTGNTSQSTPRAGIKEPKSEVETLTKKVFDFMMNYSLAPTDIQNMFLCYYGISFKQLELPILRHFVKKVLPHLCSGVKKQVRKDVLKACRGFSVGIMAYDGGIPYPWVFVPKSNQPAFVKKLLGSK